jgi:hypothetical protein
MSVQVHLTRIMTDVSNFWKPIADQKFRPSLYTSLQHASYHEEGSQRVSR